jgi:hypothetical protein
MGPNPQNQPQSALGGGMARQAANTLMSQPYRMHVEESKALGQQPMSPEEFVAQRQRG